MQAEKKVSVSGKAGAVSTYTQSEISNCVRFVNSVMAKASQNWVHLDPTNTTDEQFFDVFKDGTVLCSLINSAAPGSINEGSIYWKSGEKASVFRFTENVQMALKAAKNIGCVVVNIDPAMITEGRPSAIFGLLWQIMKVDSLRDVSLTNNVSVITLKHENETIKQFLSLSNEEILKRWVNFNLEKVATCERRLSSYATDLSDSVIFIHLIRVIAPQALPQEEYEEILKIEDLTERATRIIASASKMKLKRDIAIFPQDIVESSKVLTISWLASMFDTTVETSLKTPETNDPSKMIELRIAILDIFLEQLDKELPIVRSNTFSMFVQACKSLTNDTKNTMDQDNLMEILRKTDEEYSNYRKEKEAQKKEFIEKIEELNQKMAEFEEKHKILQEEKEKEIEILKNELEQTKEDNLNIKKDFDQTKEEMENLKKELEQSKEEIEIMKKEKQEIENSKKEKPENEDFEIVEKKDIIEEQEQTSLSIETTTQEDKKTEETSSEEPARLESSLSIDTAPQVFKKIEERDLDNMVKTPSDEKQQQQQPENELEKMKNELKKLKTKLCEVLNDRRDKTALLVASRKEIDHILAHSSKDIEQKALKFRYGDDLSCERLSSLADSKKSGFMVKGKGASAKKRYFVLNKNTIFYYKEKKSKEPKGFVILDRVKIEKVDAKSTSFVMKTQKKDRYYQCENEADMNSWLDAIKASLFSDIVA